MTARKPDRIPEPSYLPPNPSVGELRAEIDRTRHEAARTVTALTRKLAPPAIPTPTTVAASMGIATRYARRVPTPAWIAVVLLLLLWWRRRRTR
jgi:hypothetical protein